MIYFKYLLTLILYSYLLSGPLVSALCNSYSHRTVAFVGSIVNSVAMLLSAFTPSLKWLYFIFGVTGGRYHENLFES